MHGEIGAEGVYENVRQVEWHEGVHRTRDGRETRPERARDDNRLADGWTFVDYLREIRRCNGSRLGCG